MSHTPHRIYDYKNAIYSKIPRRSFSACSVKVTSYFIHYNPFGYPQKPELQIWYALPAYPHILSQVPCPKSLRSFSKYQQVSQLESLPQTEAPYLEWSASLSLFFNIRLYSCIKICWFSCHIITPLSFTHIISQCTDKGNTFFKSVPWSASKESLLQTDTSHLATNQALHPQIHHYYLQNPADNSA